jgi:hypothetical protein
MIPTLVFCPATGVGVIKSRFMDVRTGTGTITFVLVAPEDHDRKTAVTEYV